nr:MAG TPA: hypothetical protein [Caudoviricetes sp.]
MLVIDTPDREFYNEETNEFIIKRGQTLHFEHSLNTLTEWESIYRKPFLTREEKTAGELFDYFILMCEEDIGYSDLTDDVVMQLAAYLDDRPTATTIKNSDDRHQSMIMTSEVIYAYMANARVPFECDKWNLHRLLTLLGVIGELNSPKKKMSESKTLDEYDRINRQRQDQIRKMKEARLNANKGTIDTAKI